MNKSKEVVKSEPSFRGNYNGYDVFATYVSVYNYNRDGVCTGGSDRTEWHATNGNNVIEARTRKELLKRIDII